MFYYSPLFLPLHQQARRPACLPVDKEYQFKFLFTRNARSNSIYKKNKLINYLPVLKKTIFQVEADGVKELTLPLTLTTAPFTRWAKDIADSPISNIIIS